MDEKFEKFLKGEEGRENKNFAFVNPVERENLKTVECVERGYFKGEDENWQRAFELFIYTVIMLSTVFYFYISICKFNGWF